jgi:hypothetical protein
LRVRSNKKQDKRKEEHAPITSYLLKARELQMPPNMSPVKKDYQNNTTSRPGILRNQGQFTKNVYGRDLDGDSSELDESLNYSVKSFKINENFSKAISSGLGSVPLVNLTSQRQNVMTLTLHANDLTDGALIEILNSIPCKSLQRLAITSNPKITGKSYEVLGNRLNQTAGAEYFSKIESLSLENNQITAAHLKALASATV